MFFARKEVAARINITAEQQPQQGNDHEMTPHPLEDSPAGHSHSHLSQATTTAGRDKLGIDQHQRRALRLDTRDIGCVIKKSSAAGRLRVTKRRLNRSERWPRAGQSEIRTEFILQESHQI